MPVTPAAQVDIAGIAALDPVRLRCRLRRDRIERRAEMCGGIDAIAFIPILERDRQLRLAAVDDGVGKAVDRDTSRRFFAAKIGMQISRVPDERDVSRGARIDRRGRDVYV